MRRRNSFNIDDDDNDAQFRNELRVTPEFRKYVGKQLSQILDGVLDETLSEELSPPPQQTKRKQKQRQHEGIKLLRSSKSVLNEETIKGTSSAKRRPHRTSDKDLINKCRLVAVSGADILSQNDTKFWSTRSKAPIVNYYKTKSGLLVEKTTK